MNKNFYFKWPKTTDQDFTQIYPNSSYWKTTLDNFKAYEEILASKKSNRPSSYLISMVRMLSNYIRWFGPLPTNYQSEDFLFQLDQLTHAEGFRDFNEKEGRFPRASVHAFIRFANIGTFQLIKGIEKAREQKDAKNSSPNKFITTIKSKEPQHKETSKQYWERDPKIRELCKQRAAWQCQFDPDHKTFISKSNNMPYMEAHHLIPMNAQDQFTKNIDIIQNMICLCPTCHREIHLGAFREKMISHFYFKMIDGLRKKGIDISLPDLLKIYGVE